MRWKLGVDPFFLSFSLLLQFVLESPSDVMSLKFHPSKTEYIIGGCYNGQVILWDTGSVQEYIFRKEGEDDEKELSATTIIRHTLISAVDISHNMIVSDIVWLPEKYEGP
ncbi:hypothetical protein CBR_g34158 [Chara braunii]|uniref:Uncharacterized protein n=1 Tax=Chara braunii TaxID=69332 RepID=A0A388LI41_CHABU|nr:hypothetical protein CBR_g34158 [Chara braunii]|eukprot:GBG81979.1 hypothetical protein CBR_g34158 [Chara braunii]